MPNDVRRDPDELLQRVNDEERRARRGRLVVFFGAAPGVGKTYAMLEAARSERDSKRDVVVGIVETHGRYDTGALVIGLELLPRRKETHRGVVVEELDLDAALARKPGLILIDELAHTNVAQSQGELGVRHAKRWQDVEELLAAGIDVYTTLNVQHIESLNDVVAQITGIKVRETVPDRILEDASEVRLIDLPPDELLERLDEGKVYVPEQAARAASGFFRKGNLIALRELALRCTADRVDAQMRVYKTAHGIDRTWATTDRVLVCVSPSPASARLVRGARRMATSLHAPWIAVYIETPATLRLSNADRQRANDNLRLAEQLGAETAVLRGERAADETLRYARSRNVTKIVLGKPTHSRWRDLFRTSFLEEIVRASGEIDIHVISGDDAAPRDARSSLEAQKPPHANTRQAPAAYVAAAGAVVAMTLASWLVFGPSYMADAVMLYLLAIIVVAMRFGYGPSIAATVLSVLSLDFFFVPPFFSFAVTDLQHVVTFAVMFVVALVISSLTKRIRDQADSARSREQRTASLYGMSRELAASRETESLVGAAIRHLSDVFESHSAILLSRPSGLEPTDTRGFVMDPKERGVADWVWKNGRAAGLGTDTLPSAHALYVPLRGARGNVGVLALRPNDARPIDAERRQLLDVFAIQIGSALDRGEAK